MAGGVQGGQEVGFAGLVGVDEPLEGLEFQLGGCRGGGQLAAQGVAAGRADLVQLVFPDVAIPVLALVSSATVGAVVGARRPARPLTPTPAPVRRRSAGRSSTRRRRFVRLCGRFREQPWSQAGRLGTT